MGTILANFQSSGKTPDFKERLKSLVTLGVILQLVRFSIWAEIPSAPVDFDTHREEISSKTSSSVQRSSSGNAIFGGKV